jgi:hypothetical protein
VPYTRVTTIADTLDERRALEKWLQRQVAVGLALRPDLVALTVAAGDDKSKLDAICQQAAEAAAATARANMGTALHELTARVDRGETVKAPPAIEADLDAYRRTTEGIEMLRIEELVVLDEHRVAGTPDRIGRLHDGRVVILDLKTGSVEYGWRAFAVQLAAYAHASHGYDVATDTRTELPTVDSERAIVVHLPAGQARCELHEVDVAAGWHGFAMAVDVRAWRQRRDLAHPYASAPPATADEGALVPLAEVDALRDRVRALRPPARAVLAQLVSEADAAGVDFRPSVRGTARRVAIHSAAVAVADVVDGDPDVTRTAITLVTGAEPQPTFPLGAVLGSLTTAEALRLHGLLLELAAGERRLILTEAGPTFPSSVP